ncbi:FAD-binding protein [Calidifontibacter sp. DB0510]|uniref:L-aspartate oxidase n=1 Tax=Metallococcus carri TaxID=1656884 RepID=A0A967AYK7_9MICO|nr:FAD-binding protein [Metallococcus carri]NHN54200.1 FAD-binding protein [Metallococcus carri]NOP36960.1 FAD-binding protein [Calidifontibacter sp. DB2511S]
MDRPVVVGSGLAGLSAALELGDCVLVTPGPLTEGAASMWAQGGVAAALGPDDSPVLHAADTWRAGAFVGDRDTIDRITAAAPDVVHSLAALGAPFDRTATGDFHLGLEGGHSRHRIAHAADRSGAAVTSAVARAVAARSDIQVVHGRAIRLCHNGMRITGVVIATAEGEHTIDTDRVVLATGGLGGLFAHTTNPTSALGQGVALGARLGAKVADLHLVQFHPTALDVGADPMPLVTEALRGAGAVLLSDGQRFVDELQPRDVVAAAVWRELTLQRRVTLDATHVPDVLHRFTAVADLCRRHGLDVAREHLPIRPAVHYAMGGLRVDHRCRTTVSGLWAVGECARTGLHGANRLASNSLLEAVVTGRAAARDAAAWTPRPGVHPLLDVRPTATDPLVLDLVRTTLDEHCGVLRDRRGLLRAVDTLAPLAATDDAAFVAHLIAQSALEHPQSVGAHRRTDELAPQEVSA